MIQYFNKYLMKTKNPVIKKLLEHYKEISLLGKIKALLDWDLNVNLPSKAAAGRAEQSAYLAKRGTDLWLDTDFRKIVEKANKQTDLTKEEQALLRNINIAGKYYFNIPQKLIIEKEQASSKAFMVWKEARQNNDFKAFLPSLQTLIAIDRKMATYIGYKDNPYDALLDIHEPELTATYTKKMFDAIKPKLIELTKRMQEYKDDEQLEKKYINDKSSYPLEKQKELSLMIMKLMGYDFQAGRLDVSPHPFTTSLDRYDVRITNAYHENDFRFSFTSTTHESGHALYEQGVDPSYNETPLAGGVSYGIHEALSRFWENMVGKNPQFLKYVTPEFQKAFPKQLGKITPDEFAKLFHVVKPSFIRIESDEVTYSLHIILRFEIENELINGKIKPADAARVWKDKSEEYFGIRPDTDSRGVLQDVHWAYGAFGYFPSYAMGNLYGAQLLHAMKKTVDFDKEVGKGKLQNVHTWLDKNIHTYGSLYFPRELIKRATGEELNPQYFVDYLTSKYQKLYK
jgi:carboxypeptidase Taq